MHRYTFSDCFGAAGLCLSLYFCFRSQYERERGWESKMYMESSHKTNNKFNGNEYVSGSKHNQVLSFSRHFKWMCPFVVLSHTYTHTYIHTHSAQWRHSIRTNKQNNNNNNKTQSFVSNWKCKNISSKIDAEHRRSSSFSFIKKN